MPEFVCARFPQFLASQRAAFVPEALDAEAVAQAVKEFGVNSVLVSTRLGQSGNVGTPTASRQRSPLE